MKTGIVDRRALIFCVFGVVSLVMLIPCPADFRYVGWAVATAYFMLGTFSWLDAIFRARSGRRK